ncbi:hypothetical protein AAEX28_15695 [Lentisphaerota bacterium WC36G]|nr:hypothetical protein LJT99_02460 [Lentisphaerae bacterium WC36]
MKRVVLLFSLFCSISLFFGCEPSMDDFSVIGQYYYNENSDYNMYAICYKEKVQYIMFIKKGVSCKEISYIKFDKKLIASKGLTYFSSYKNKVYFDGQKINVLGKFLIVDKSEVHEIKLPEIELDKLKYKEDGKTWITKKMWDEEIIPSFNKTKKKK